MLKNGKYPKSLESSFENGVALLLYLGGANFFVFLRPIGVEEMPHLDLGISESIYASTYLRASLGGALIGTLILINEKFLYPKFNSLPFWKQRLLWNLDTAFIIVFSIFSVAIVGQWLISGNDFSNSLKAVWSFLKSPLFLSFFVYYYLVSVLLSFLRRLRSTFGQHVFYNYIMGKYATPKVEDRTFMFIDLTNSTGLAESLGHEKYSRLLNFCFEDINMALRDFTYDIYQFVGDEVVITWKSHPDQGQAFKMFVAIKQILKDHQMLYENKFGVVPAFKASVSSGKVTATLVGGKSKSIAYHGDVLNTAARVLSQCNALNRDFLFTDFYLASSDISRYYFVEKISTIKLKGKTNQTNIYAIALN